MFPNSQDDDNFGTTSIEENNTHTEGNVSDETDLVGDFYKNSEFNSESADFPVNIVRRFSRQTKLPTSLNDFMIDVSFDELLLPNLFAIPLDEGGHISGFLK
ncbi:hypothetical protein Tco_0689822 [Tanacetum coccineum]